LPEDLGFSKLLLGATDLNPAKHPIQWSHHQTRRTRVPGCSAL
jgi:hypothetical protein